MGMVAQIQACTGVAAQQASCANSITSLITTIISAAATSGKIAGDCPAATSGAPVKESQKVVKYGGCVVDVWQASWFLARVGILINSAVIECDGNNGDKSKCGVRASGIVASFVAAAHFITAAVNHCGPNYDYGLACASHVLKLVAVLDAVAMAAVGIDNSCVEKSSRRLANSTVESSLPSIGSLDDDERAILAKMNLTEEDMYADPRRVIVALRQQEQKMVTNVTSPIVV